MNAKRKRCRICNAVLSIYNPEDICFCHQDGMIVHEYSPTSIFTSYSKDAEDDKDNDIDSEFYPKPGEEEYTRRAFNKSITGVIVDGKVTDFNEEQKNEEE